MTRARRTRTVPRAAGGSLLPAVPAAVPTSRGRVACSAVLRLDERAVASATAAVRGRARFRRGLVVWQELSQPGWFVLAGSGVCAWLWRRHGLGSLALWGVVTLLASWGASAGLKLLVRRTRPLVDEPLSHAGGFSFPSGHATGAAAAGAVVTIALWPVLRVRGRLVLVAAAVTVAGTTAVDRVMLGVHHPSDVVAGLVLGGAVTAGSGIAWGIRHHSRVRR